MSDATVEAADSAAPPPRDPAEAFRLRGDPPRVMRLSRRTLALMGVAAGCGIGGSLLYALQPRHTAPAANLYATDGRNKAESVTGAPADYSKVPKLGPPLPGDLGRPILSAQAGGQPVPVPPIGAGPSGTTDPARAAAEQARLRASQERDAARASRLFSGESAGAADGRATADAAARGSLPDASPPITGSAPTQSDQRAKRAFLETGSARGPVSPGRLVAPASPNILQAGSIIPAALITGIRSDLPGQISAQVTQNIYDSPTGRTLLIPQGSRLIGDYDSEVSAGQRRVLLAWDRLILPDGRSIRLERQPGTDAAGYAGLQDRTDRHWGAMLKAAFVSTLLGIGTNLVTDSDNDLLQALRYGTQDTVNQTGRQLAQREINVPPTLTIRPGFALRVIVTRDLILDPTTGDQR